MRGCLGCKHVKLEPIALVSRAILWRTWLAKRLLHLGFAMLLGVIHDIVLGVLSCVNCFDVFYHHTFYVMMLYDYFFLKVVFFESHFVMVFYAVIIFE